VPPRPCLPRATHTLTHTPQFDPDCFEFVLAFFRDAAERFHGTPGGPPGLVAAQQHLIDGPPSPELGGASPAQNPLLTKQAIIVLREELEYFAIPPRGAGAGTDGAGLANDALLALKRDAGGYLLGKRNIFTALQRNVNKENNVAEQHLIDMLCMRCDARRGSRRGLALTRPAAASTATTSGASARSSPRAAASRPSRSSSSRPASRTTPTRRSPSTTRR
jgi:hypothetical protein